MFKKSQHILRKLKKCQGISRNLKKSEEIFKKSFLRKQKEKKPIYIYIKNSWPSAPAAFTGTSTSLREFT